MASFRRSVSWEQRVIKTANEKIGEKRGESSPFFAVRVIRKFEKLRVREIGIPLFSAGRKLYSG